MEWIAKDKAVCVLSREELSLLMNCINETLEALDDWDFPIRTGGEMTEAIGLQRALRAARDQLPYDYT